MDGFLSDILAIYVYVEMLVTTYVANSDVYTYPQVISIKSLTNICSELLIALNRCAKSIFWLDFKFRFLIWAFGICNENSLVTGVTLNGIPLWSWRAIASSRLFVHILNRKITIRLKDCANSSWVYIYMYIYIIVMNYLYILDQYSTKSFQLSQ